MKKRKKKEWREREKLRIGVNKRIKERKKIHREKDLTEKLRWVYQYLQLFQH